MGKNKSQILELNIILTFSLEIGTDPEGVLWGRSTTPPHHLWQQYGNFSQKDGNYYVKTLGLPLTNHLSGNLASDPGNVFSIYICVII